MAATGQFGEFFARSDDARGGAALRIIPCRWKLCPSARGTWPVSRGLISRDGAGPEKKIAKNFGGIHKAIVGETIAEVKVSCSAVTALSYSERTPCNTLITISLPVLFMSVPLDRSSASPRKTRRRVMSRAISLCRSHLGLVAEITGIPVRLST